MQLKPLTAAIFMLVFLSRCYGKDCVSKQTTKPRHLKQLLETKKCSGCYLGDADLSGADLAGANLSGAMLVKANLDGANLQQANLSNAQLSWYDIDDGWGTRNSCDVDFSASLKKANLQGANLERANLRKVDLEQGNLSYANLKDADLHKANLEKVTHRGLILQKPI